MVKPGRNKNFLMRQWYVLQGMSKSSKAFLLHHIIIDAFYIQHIIRTSKFHPRPVVISAHSFLQRHIIKVCWYFYKIKVKCAHHKKTLSSTIWNGQMFLFLPKTAREENLRKIITEE